jgi:serine O-acetyltransferase
MILAIEKNKLLSLLTTQLNNFFIEEEEKGELVDNLDEAIVRLEECFKNSSNKYYNREIDGKQEGFFNPFHSVQYMIFLYILANTIYVKGSKTFICDKLYYLNKMLNGVDLFYQVNLPKHFGAEHPVGSVIGRAKIGDYFYFYQNVTLGGVIKQGCEVYPQLGCHVEMCSNSSILGDCIIGDNVIIGAGAIVKNQNIPDNSIVFGQSPNIIIKPNKNKIINF